MLEKTFGHKKPDVIYQERTGAYGIGFSADGRVPVAMTHLHNGEKGYFLLAVVLRLLKVTLTASSGNLWKRQALVLFRKSSSAEVIIITMCTE